MDAAQQKTFFKPFHRALLGRLSRKRGRNGGFRMALMPRALASERGLDWHDQRTDSRAPILAALRRKSVPQHIANEAAAYHARLFEVAWDKVQRKKPTQINTAEQALCVAARNLGTWRSVKRRKARGESVARDKHREYLNRLLLSIGMLEAGWGWVSPVHFSEAEAQNYAPNVRLKMSGIIPSVPVKICGQIGREIDSVHKFVFLEPHFSSRSSIAPKSAATLRAGKKQVAAGRARDARGRFEARRPPPIFRPEAGSAAPQPPSLQDNFLPPCNPKPVAVHAPSPEPTPVAEVAGAVVPASANAFLARAQAVQARVSRETIAERERRWAEAEARHAATKARIPAQGGHHVTSSSVRDALATAPVLRAVDRPDDGAMPVGLEAPQPPPRGARQHLRAQIPQAERRVHDRAMVRLAEALGTPTLTPDEHRLCRSAASDADLAVIFGRVGDPTALARMRRSGLSAAAWYQAREHMAHCRADGVRDGRAVLCHAARQYQAHFDGRDGGWSPYAAYRRASSRRPYARRH